MRRKGNEVCPSFLLLSISHLSFPNTQFIVYCVLSCFYRVSVKCLDFDSAGCDAGGKQHQKLESGGEIIPENQGKESGVGDGERM